MAFPTVASRTPTNGPTLGTSFTVALDGAAIAGDRLTLLMRSVGLPTSINLPADWTKIKEVDDATSVDRTIYAYKDLTAGDAEIGAATMTVTTTGGSMKAAFIVRRIDAGTFDPAVPPEVSADATGTSTTPDPGSLTVSWGAADTLWEWNGGWEGEQTSPPTGNPTNYSNPTGADSGVAGAVTNNVRVATADRALNAATEDPPSWTISVSDGWIAWTVAHKPTGAGAQTITCTSIVRTRAFGTAVLTLGSVDVAPASIVRTRAFGTPRIDLEVAPPSIVNSRAFGSLTVTQGPAALLPASIVRLREFGSATVVGEGAFVTPTSVERTRAFGSHTLTTGNVTVLAPSIIHDRSITVNHVVGEPFVEPQGQVSHSPGAPFRGFRHQSRVRPS